MYLQEKFNIYNSGYVYHFNISYFINEKEAAQFNYDYFQKIFDEVHITKQEDGDYLLELFDLKKSILQEFDFYFKNDILDKSYSCIINFVNQQDVLLHKSPQTGYHQVKNINIFNGIQHDTDLYLKQLIKKYSLLKNRHDTPSFIIPTPFIKWTKEVEENVSSYFGWYFQDIKLDLAKIDEINYIVAIDLSGLKEEKIDNSIKDLLLLIQ